jgi:hypothetical protein
MQTTPAPAPASRIKTVERYETSDGRAYQTHEEARQHEAFLDVKHVVPGQIHRGAAHAHQDLAYKVIKALAAEYDFVPRKPSTVTVTVMNQAEKSALLRGMLADQFETYSRGGIAR